MRCLVQELMSLFMKGQKYFAITYRFVVRTHGYAKSVGICGLSILPKDSQYILDVESKIGNR